MTPPWKELFSGDAKRLHSFEDAQADYEGLLKSYTANGYEVVLIPKGPSRWGCVRQTICPGTMRTRFSMRLETC